MDGTDAPRLVCGCPVSLRVQISNSRSYSRPTKPVEIDLPGTYLRKSVGGDFIVRFDGDPSEQQLYLPTTAVSTRIPSTWDSKCAYNHLLKVDHDADTPLMPLKNFLPEKMRKVTSE